MTKFVVIETFSNYEEARDKVRELNGVKNEVSKGSYEFSLKKESKNKWLILQEVIKEKAIERPKKRNKLQQKQFLKKQALLKEVLELKKNGNTHKKISEILKIPITTISNWVLDVR